MFQQTGRIQPQCISLDGEMEEAIIVDKLMGIRVRKVSKTSKAKNSFTIMVYSNGIPICMDESGGYHHCCFHHSLFKGFAQQIVQMIDSKARKTYFPNIAVSSSTLQKDVFNASTEHMTFEYDRYLDSQGTELFLVINVSHNIEYLDSYSLESLKTNISSSISKDLVRYLQSSYRALAKKEIFHSMGQKKMVYLEPCSIPALASLLSDLTDEIPIDNSDKAFYEFASLTQENKVDLLKKSLTKICLFENALGQKLSKK